MAFKNPNTPVINRIKARRAKRAEKKANAKALGGSLAEEQKLYDEARSDQKETRADAKAAAHESRVELEHARQSQAGSQWEYRADFYERQKRAQEARDDVSNIGSSADRAAATYGAAGSTAQDEYSLGAKQAADTRTNALATHSLANSAENVLAQRRTDIAATPTIGRLTNDAITANNANAADRLKAQQGSLVRQGMGMAAGQGEGAGLAMQQALASTTAASGDAAVTNNLALRDEAARMRYAAAQAQRDQDLGEAGYAADTRLSAAGAEREAQLGIAGQNAASQEAAAAARAATGMTVGASQAEVQYQSALAQQAAKQAAVQAAQAAVGTSNQRDLQLESQRANVAGQNATTAANTASGDKDYTANLINAKYGAQNNREDSKERSLGQKIFMPFGILGN